MSRMETKLKCFKCKTLPRQFAILSCNHLLCADCLNRAKHNQSSNCIQCECNQQTFISDITKSTQSLKNYLSCSPKTISTINLPEQIQNVKKKPKVVNQFSLQSTELIDAVKTQPSEEDNKTKYKNNSISSQFSKQLQFAQTKFKKGIQELRQMFEMQISKLNKTFGQYKDQIQLCLIDLYNIVPGHLINAPKICKQRYSMIAEQIQRFHNILYENFAKDKLSKQNNTYLINRPLNVSRHQCKFDLSEYSTSYISPPKNISLYGLKKTSKARHNYVEELIWQHKNYSRNRYNYE